MSDKRLVIIDGYSLLFRAFFATRFLSTSDGRPTNALFGFVGMLLTLFERQKPDAVVVALDAPAKTFREIEFAEYKGTRKETPMELTQQFPVARHLIEALGIPFYEVDGFEADDVLGTLSRLAEEAGYDTTIVTGDLDALQLVDHCVSVMTSKQGVTDVFVYGPDEVRARYGFGPEFITDYKALVGDTSDNIPGVPGIGEKSATKLILEFGSIESMLEKLDQVEEKFRKKIEPNIEQLKKSKWLATIVRDVPLTYDFAPFKLTEEQLTTAVAMMESLEFKNFMRRVPLILGPYVEGGAGRAAVMLATVEAQPIEGKIVGKGDLAAVQKWLDGKPYAMVFPASVGQLSMFDEAVPQQAFVAFENSVFEVSSQTALELFASDPGRATLHDAKPLYKMIDAGLVPPRFDTMLAGYVLQSGRSSYALRDLCQGYLDTPLPADPQNQAAALFALAGVLHERLVKEDQLKVCESMEFPLVPILAEMEQTGVAVNKLFLTDFSELLQKDIVVLTQKIHEQAGQEFLIASPKQLGEILFEKLGIPAGKKTKTGWATGAEVLQELVVDHPICGDVLNWRELTKLKSTYADALPKMIGPDGRIHTSYNQTVAATGRLSSNDPNLQNIPIRTELGRTIRKAFVAAEGYALGSFDYSQIELRILAHMCKDDVLIDAFQKRIDVHTVTASMMFHIETDSVSKEQRRLAKMLNYAVLYGVTDFGLAQQLGEGFGVKESKALILQYFERFPKVKAFTDSVIAEAKQKGFTATLCGRRRYFPEIHAANRAERLYAERQAVNAPIQGAASDLVKLAMIKVRKELGASPSRMLLQVHDELVFELGTDSKDLISPLTKSMENAMPIDVPIEVDAKVGPNWNDMTPQPH